MVPVELVTLVATHILVAASVVGQTGKAQVNDRHTEYRNLATAANDGASAAGIGPSLSPSIATPSGIQYRVVKLVREFTLPQRGIHQWGPQRRIRVGTVDLGMIKARVIIDEDEDEERLGIQP